MISHSKAALTDEELKARYAWSLDRKIEESCDRIVDWHSRFGGRVSVSFSGGLDSTVLLDLVRLLASLMNGCEYCIQLHSNDLKKMHEPEERIAGLGDWRASSAYTQRERAAFAWTEAVTNIQDGHADDAVYAQVREHFSEVEMVNLTLAITTINAWNRIAIALGDYPRHAGVVAK